jgi:hypothetical protein
VEYGTPARPPDHQSCDQLQLLADSNLTPLLRISSFHTAYEAANAAPIPAPVL